MHFRNYGKSVRFQDLKIGALWGSNLAGKAGNNPESSLRIVCERAYYDTIIINTIEDVANDDNKGNLPGLNFTKHCFTTFGKDYKTYLRCDSMGSDIQYCQSRGIKVLLNIGGNDKFIGFNSAGEAKHFASLLWKLFLGGFSQTLDRTFGRVVLDGINIEVRYGQGSFFVDFVRELRKTMDNSNTRKPYLITANPNCVQPSYILDESFEKEIAAFDHLFVNFDDQRCSVNRPHLFEPNFDSWNDYAIKPGGPKIWIGLPSDPRNTHNSQMYLARRDAKETLEKIAKQYPKFGGVLLNDASWDFENRIIDKPYSQLLAGILRPSRIPGQNDIVTAKPKTSDKSKSGKDGEKDDSDDDSNDTKTNQKERESPGTEIRFGGSCTTQSSVMVLILGLAVFFWI